MIAVEKICQISRQAGEKIIVVFNSGDFGVETKSDNSPLTQADLASHHTICDALAELDDSIPILSEESVAIDYEERKQWQRYWLIDPLDGTKEFIAKRPEFTVNIALIEDGRPVLGVIYVPCTGVCYFAQKGKGAFRQEGDAPPEKITTRKVPLVDGKPHLTVVMSRHSGRSKVGALLEPLGDNYDQASIGSSLKMCMVAEGKADFYPRLGPTSEWDTAAAQTIVEAAGGVMLGRDHQPMRYNQKASILNDHFYVMGEPDFPWQTWCRFE